MTSLRSTTETGRLLAAATVAVCLFFAFYGRLLGTVAFLLTIGSGVGFIVLLAGYNGYDRGSEVTAMLIGAIIAIGPLAGMALTDVQAILSRGPGHADVPNGVPGSLWVAAVFVGLFVHRAGAFVRNRRSDER